MKAKKIVCGVVAAVMLAGVFSGCGKEKTADLNGVDAENMNDKLTINWLGIPYNPSAQEGTIPEKILEEKFNVDIKPVFFAEQNFNEKKTMMMAGGEIPDLIYELDPVNVAQDADQGFIMELPYDTIKKYAPTVYAELNKEAPEAWLYSRVGDKNYGLPNLNLNNGYSRMCVWRMDWLKNVGIDKVPETIDEMYEALLRFKNNDPDGNGKNDTYGMSGDIKNWHTMFTEIFGAYGVLPFNWMRDGETVVYGGLQDGTKEALKTLRQWYSEGLIHPDFITDNVFNTGKDKFTNGLVGYMNQNGGYWDPTAATSLINIVHQVNPAAEIENAKPPKGPDGKAGSQIWGKPCHILAFGVQNEKSPEKVARILTILEGLMTDEELMAKVRLGEKDKEWTYKDPSAGLDNGIQFLYPYDDPNQLKNECLNANFGSPSFFVPISATDSIFQKYRTKAERDIYEKYSSPELGMTDAFTKPDTLPSSSEYFIDLRTKQINLMVQIIKGEKTVEQYSEFEELWKSQGGATLEKEAQEMNDSMKKIYQEVGVSK